jgi:predicted site-specific integrase-resolvase
MHYTLGTAAKATGKSKPTIQRAIKSGKISAQKDANGEWNIQPSELHRIFQPIAENSVTESASVNDDALRNVTLHERLEAALCRITDKEDQLRLQANQIEDLQKDRDHWRQQATYLIEDKRKIEQDKALVVVPTKKWWQVW